MELRHIAEREGRLSSFLRGEMGMSSGLMNRIKWSGDLFVNGLPVHTDYPVKLGDVIVVPLNEPEPAYPAEMTPVDVVYEDAHILAVDKPAGMLIHPSRAQMTGTLANRVIGYYQRSGQRSAFHPITRLDRDTFGIVLLAKNAHIHSLFNMQHNQGQFRKIYHGLVVGVPSQPEGIIDAPIARRPLPSLLRYVCADGKPSVTRYRVLSCQGELAKLELQPVTGRTHQLRVHCAHMGWPILGDPQYNTDKSVMLSQQLGAKTQLLCAKELAFPHPITGEPMVLQSNMEVC